MALTQADCLRRLRNNFLEYRDLYRDRRQPNDPIQPAEETLTQLIDALQEVLDLPVNMQNLANPVFEHWVNMMRMVMAGEDNRETHALLAHIFDRYEAEMAAIFRGEEPPEPERFVLPDLGEPLRNNDDDAGVNGDDEDDGDEEADRQIRERLAARRRPVDDDDDDDDEDMEIGDRLVDDAIQRLVRNARRRRFPIEIEDFHRAVRDARIAGERLRMGLPDLRPEAIEIELENPDEDDEIAVIPQWADEDPEQRQEDAMERMRAAIDLDFQALFDDEMAMDGDEIEEEDRAPHDILMFNLLDDVAQPPPRNRPAKRIPESTKLYLPRNNAKNYASWTKRDVNIWAHEFIRYDDHLELIRKKEFDGNQLFQFLESDDQWKRDNWPYGVYIQLKTHLNRVINEYHEYDYDSD